MSATKKAPIIPPEAVVCARLVLQGFGYEVQTEHVAAALRELLWWQDRNKDRTGERGND